MVRQGRRRARRLPDADGRQGLRHRRGAEGADRSRHAVLTADIDGALHEVVARLGSRGDRRLARGTILGGLSAAAQALAAEDPDAIAQVAQPWEREALSAVRPGGDYAHVTGVALDADGDPPTLEGRFADGRRIVLRMVGDGWRLAHLVEPGAPLPPVTPEATWTFPLPRSWMDDELRWLCLALEDVSEALGDRVYTMPGRPMRRETVDVGSQGETCDTAWSGWQVGPGAHLEVECSRHEILDGATPSWTTLHGLVRGLRDGAGARLNVSLSGANPTVRVLLTAPRPVLDAAVGALEAMPEIPGARAL